MPSFITENLSTIIVGIIVFSIFTAVVIKLIVDKKKKKSTCGCACSGCPGSQSCKHE